MMLIDRPIIDNTSLKTYRLSVQAPEPVLKPQEVIGSGDEKKALIIAPFESYFGDLDPSRVAKDKLSTLKEFDGNIKVLQNGEAGVEAFVENKFSEYDIVFITGHGAQASIATGDKFSTAMSKEETFAELVKFDRTGLALGQFTGDSPYRNVVVTKDFFQEYQKGNQRKNLIILDGCQVFAGSEGLELVKLLAGPNGAVVGWNNFVSDRVSYESNEALLNELIKTGLPLEDALRNIFLAGKGQQPKSENYPEGASMRIEGNLRIRDIISVTDYELAGKPDDGIDDKIKLTVKIDGIKEGQESSFVIDFALDGSNIGQAVVKEEDATDSAYTYVLTTEPLALGEDVKTDQPYILEAIVTLPEGGVSQTSLPLVFRCASNTLRTQQTCEGPSLSFHSVLETTTSQSVYSSEVAADISLSQYGPDNQLIGIGPLNYVSFEALILDSDCAVTTSTQDGTLHIVKVELPTNEQDEITSDIPEKVVLLPLTDIFESIYCDGVPVIENSIFWYAGFASWHGGELGGENELDEDEGGFVMRGWEKGTDGIIRKTYERTYSTFEGDEPVTYTEATTIELSNIRIK